MSCYDIAITTFKRTDYLKSLLQSICDSDIDNANIYIRDDYRGTTDYDFLHNLKADKKIKNLYFEIATGMSGSYCNARSIITTAFDASDNDYVVYIQDDAIVSRRWLLDGIGIYLHAIAENNDIAIMSLYHWKGDSGDNGYNIMHAGHPGGVCWVINRRFWNWYTAAYPFAIEADCRCKNLVDYRVCSHARKHGWLIAYTNVTYVKHIGLRSSITPGRKVAEALRYGGMHLAKDLFDI